MNDFKRGLRPKKHQKRSSGKSYTYELERPYRERKLQELGEMFYESSEEVRAKMKDKAKPEAPEKEER